VSTAPLPKAGSPLSDREVQVLRLVAAGFVHDRIGRALGISPNTVRSHMARIRARLGESDRAALVRAGFERGWLRLPDAVVVAQAEQVRARQQERYLAKVRADLARQAAARGAA
jgi:DNA-binding CsgD family transcriptional regulator